MSTLTLRIFGLEPDAETIKSKVKNIDSSHEKYNLINNNIERINNDIERIDRDVIRKKLYDKVELDFELDSTNKNLYDLSNNEKKYKLVDTILNYYGDNEFIHYITNSNLYKRLFYNNNYDNNNIYNNLYNINQSNFTVNNLDNYLTQIYNNDITPGASYSYANTDNVKNLFHTPGDGFLIYRKQVLQQFTKEYPNFSQVRRDKLIENEWNSLSSEDQEVYNQRARKSSSKSKYDPNNLSNYRSPLIRSSYIRNRKDTDDKIAECPPGKTKIGNECLHYSLYKDNYISYN